MDTKSTLSSGCNSGYCFGSGVSSSGFDWPGSSGWSKCQKDPLLKDDEGRNLRGRFVEWVDIGNAVPGGTIDMGAKTVKLTA